MADYLQYIQGISLIGLVCLFFIMMHIKNGIKTEIVDPEVQPLKEVIKEIQDEVKLLKEHDKDLSDKMDIQFDSVKESLSVTNQSISKMQGTLDLLVKQLIK